MGESGFIGNHYDELPGMGFWEEWRFLGDTWWPDMMTGARLRTDVPSPAPMLGRAARYVHLDTVHCDGL